MYDAAKAAYSKGLHDEALTMWSAALTMLEDGEGADDQEEASSLATKLRLARATVWQKQKQFVKAEAEYAAILVGA